MKKNYLLFSLIFLLLVLAIVFVRKRDLRLTQPSNKTVILINRSKYGYDYEMIATGAKRSAKEFGAQLKILAPDNEKDVEAQKILLEEAANSESVGVALVPIKTMDMIEQIHQLQESKKKLMLIHDEGGQQLAPYTGTDNKALGRCVGEKIIQASQQAPKNQPIVIGIYASKNMNGEVKQYLQGLQQVLSKSEEHIMVKYSLDNAKEKYAYQSLLKEQTKTITYDIVVGLDLGALTGLQASRDYLEGTLIYGFNLSTEVISGIEKGMIDEVVVPNYFAEGYLAIKRIIEPDRVQELGNQTIPYIEVNKKNLYDSEVEKMIFPLK